MTAATSTAGTPSGGAASGHGRMRRRGRPRHELYGLAALSGAGLLIALIGARWITGPIAAIAAALVLAAVVAMIWTAVAGSPEAKRRLAPYGLLKPGILWLALFYLAPLITLLRLSLSTLPSRFAVEADFDWNIGNYTRAFTDFGPQFGRAFLYAGIATVLTIAIGYPLAYVIAFRGGRYRTVLLGLVVIPFFTAYLIRTIAWTSLMSDSGQVVQLLDTLRLSGLFESIGIMHSGQILNTPSAVVGGLTYNFLPFMILPIYVSLEKIDPRLLDAAQDLYSSSARAFRKVVLPLSLPGVFAGTLLTFIPAAGDFVNALYLGSPTTTMIGNSIQDQFLVQNNTPLAAAMAFVLMFIITVFVIVYSRFFGTEDLT